MIFWLSKNCGDYYKSSIGHQKIDGWFEFFDVEHLHLFQNESRHQFPVLKKKKSRTKKCQMLGGKIKVEEDKKLVLSLAI